MYFIKICKAPRSPINLVICWLVGLQCEANYSSPFFRLFSQLSLCFILLRNGAFIVAVGFKQQNYCEKVSKLILLQRESFYSAPFNFIIGY